MCAVTAGGVEKGRMVMTGKEGCALGKVVSDAPMTKVFFLLLTVKDKRPDIQPHNQPAKQFAAHTGALGCVHSKGFVLSDMMNLTTEILSARFVFSSPLAFSGF